MPDLQDADRALVDLVEKRFQSAEDYHKQFRDKADSFYARYRNFSQWRNQRGKADARDRDVFINDAAREWGAKLSIPFGFSTIETVVPRLLSHAPKLQVFPRDEVATTENVRNMKALVDYQQDDINIEMILQDVAKDGLMIGLGVLKTFWRTTKRQKRKIVKAPVPVQGNEFIETEEEEVVFDGNDAEAVDPRDFFWDPFGYDMRSVGWIIHRLWLSHEDVMKRIASGRWRTDWDEEEIRALGSLDKLNEVWQGRFASSGFKDHQPQEGRVHEVWEYHDRDRVVTILDRRLPMQAGQNPHWHGDLPFHIYRPTRLNKEFVGVSELEPLQDLLDEMDTLRSQRRDNATLVLQKTFAYQEGLVDPADLKFGPGLGIPVGGMPSELLFPIPVGDIPNSGYQEEAALLSDIERTSGLSDAVAGSEGPTGGASATATGAQLVHSAANVRIQNKTKLLEKETIRGCASQWIENNQQHVIEKSIPIQGPPVPGSSVPTWQFAKLTPPELQGRMIIVPEGGATAPENTPQKRSDAQMKMQMLAQVPEIDKRRLLMSVLQDMGVEMPESWIVQGGQVPASVLQILAQQGVDEQQIAQALQMADAMQRGASPEEALQGPQNGSQGGSGPPQQGPPKKSSNGSQPPDRNETQKAR